MRTTANDNLIRVSGIPSGLFGCPAAADIPTNDIKQAIRQALRNAKVGYYVGGAGYDYHIEADDIVAIAAPPYIPATLERRGNTIYQHGQPATASADIIVRPTGERRRISLNLATYQ